MLPRGSQVAPSACLKHQLRNIILGLGGRRAVQPLQRCCPFSTQSSRRQEASTLPDYTRPLSHKERDYVYRHIHPQGRIIGKGRRRQRQSSEQLATNSLGRPSEVIVMRDVPEEMAEEELDVRDASSQADEDSQAVLSLQEIQQTLAGQHLPPDQAEVNASIDSLRPNVAVIDRIEFERLKKQMIDSYNMKQLARYLVQAVSTSTPSETHELAPKDRKSIHRTAWRPGRTPWNQRLDRVSFRKGELSNSKAGLAEQIIRTAWHLTLSSEQQSLGELELYVKHWQIKLLFNNRPGRTIEKLIGSQFLLQSCDIRPYREDNVIRITARSADAEEVARLLERALSKWHRSEMDLNIFKPLLGQPGWPITTQELFSDADLEFVSHRTESVVEVEPDGKLAIYSLQPPDVFSTQAQRMLLTLLDLPSAKEVESVIPTAGTSARKQGVVMRTFSGNPEALQRAIFPVLSVHRRYRDLELSRRARPQARAPTKPVEPAVVSDTEWKRLMRRLASRLDAFEVSAAANATEERRTKTTSVWQAANQPPYWSARFGAWLHGDMTRMSSREPARKRRESVAVKHSIGLFLDQATSLETALSHFIPADHASTQSDDIKGDSTAPDDSELLVHLVPSPFTSHGVNALKTLPRICLTYNFSRLGVLKTRSGHARQKKLELTHVSASVGQQELNVAFPDHVNDLSFRRVCDVAMDKQAMSQDGGLRNFTRELEASLNNSSGVLHAKSALTFNFPRWMVQQREDDTDADAGGVQAEYLLDNFEQVQQADFVPLNLEKRLMCMEPEARAMIEQWPADMRIRFRDVRGGAIGGNRMEVILIRHPKSAEQPQNDAGTKFTSTSGGEEPNAVTEKQKTEGPALQLTRTALSMLKLMTRANAGLVWSPYDSNVPQVKEVLRIQSWNSDVVRRVTPPSAFRRQMFN